MSDFFLYEEYGARYESMLCEMTITSKSIPNWHCYERGVEALANTLAPVNIREGCNRKGLTFGDLLIKVFRGILLLVLYHGNFSIAHSTCVQVSSLVCRPSQAFACNRLS
jgi:hypothetical protein